MEKSEIVSWENNELTMPNISIILLLKNAERYLEEILFSIRNQAYEGKIEIIAIDSGSKDRTIKILTDFGVEPFCISPSTFNHGETRNLGLQLADKSSQYLVYLTQDATPANEHWLRNLVIPMREDQKVAGTFSRHLPRPNSTPSMVRQLTQNWQTGGDKRLIKQKPQTEEDYLKSRFFLISFSNTSSAIRRSILENYPFPKTGFAEDMQWAEKVILAGYKIVYEPSSQVIHSHDYTLLEHFRQNVDHAHAMKQLYSPEAYSSIGYWLKLFGGIPIQVWMDWIFLNNSDIFKNARINKKIFYIWYSFWWHLAMNSGSLIGSLLEKLPASIQDLLVRQERIRKL